MATEMAYVTVADDGRDGLIDFQGVEYVEIERVRFVRPRYAEISGDVCRGCGAIIANPAWFDASAPHWARYCPRCGARLFEIDGRRPALATD